MLDTRRMDTTKRAESLKRVEQLRRLQSEIQDGLREAHAVQEKLTKQPRRLAS